MSPAKSKVSGRHPSLISYFLFLISYFLFLLSPSPVHAQNIRGNVYGGGNQAKVGGSTRVTVVGGNIGTRPSYATGPLSNPRGKLFGGARMADVGGNTFVHIDGEHATGYMVINQVFGGNDITGTIGTAAVVGETLPAELTEIGAADPTKNDIDNTWNTYVRLSSKITPKVEYTSETAAAYNADLTGALGSTKPLTEEEATAYNTAMSAGKSAGNVLTADEAAAYNATLAGAVSAGDVQTPAHVADDNQRVYIGQVFSGGNGDYRYESATDNGKTTHSIYASETAQAPIATIVTDEDVDDIHPTTDKAYLEVLGGSIVYAYGGGNNATVTTETVIHVDNPTEVVNHILVKEDGEEANTTTYETLESGLANGTYVSSESYEISNTTYHDLLSSARFKDMGINTALSKPSSDEFQIGRFFGGNNLAEMSIRPKWNLLGGKIRNLYSGGNKGNMTSSEGLLLEIPQNSTLIVDNLFGGCRMADVKPTLNGAYTPCTNLQDKDSEGNLIYKFPNELSARVLVRGGDVNNVYGGNDVTGRVWGGSAVGIYANVRGDVYGGGNGAYPYTDQIDMQKHDLYSDLYYSWAGALSVDALNAFRPNAEQVSIRLKGTDAMHPTIIKGSVYLGGNCATIQANKANPRVELKIGSHVIANQVFLGNNGADMVYEDDLKLYAGSVDGNGNWVSEGGTDYSTLDLTKEDVFASYMEGAAMNLQPQIVFDSQNNGDPADYEPYTSYIGSFFCGGNVGSMAIPGKNTYEVTQGLNIFEKFVGGCNNANIPAGKYNAAYAGGVLGTAGAAGVANERGNSSTNTGFYTNSGAEGDAIKDRLEINLKNLTITPLRWNNPETKQYLIWNTAKWGTVYTQVEEGESLTEGETYYTSNTGEGEFVAEKSATADASTYQKSEDFVPVSSNPADHDIRLLGGNIYGGCYNSGHVNGNVVINIKDDVLKRDEVFGAGLSELYGRQKSGVNFLDQRDDLDAVALILFGAGYGEDSEVWGSTTVNHTKGYVFQICGGGEKGPVGKGTSIDTSTLTEEEQEALEGTYDEATHKLITNKKEYTFDPRYSSTVNLCGIATATSNDGAVTNLAATEYIYGGGKEGIVAGNTLVNLGNGRLYDAFAGACEADVLGHAEAYIGRQPDGSGGYKTAFPWVQDIVYGGNDFTGTIFGNYEDGYDFTARVRDYTATKAAQLHGTPTQANPGFLKSSTYVEYLEGRVDTIFGGNYGFYDYTSEEYAGYDMPRIESSYVNIRPRNNGNNALLAVFGGGTGYPKNRAGDKSQDRSYVLIDIPKNGENYATNFETTQVFGAGSYNGLGMRFQEETNTFDDSFDPNQLSAVIDLIDGQISNVYGGSYNEGVTARTVVNVPSTSAIKLDNIFGGAYGTQILPPCDVFESNVNYNNTSETASVSGAIYGGNNNERRTLYSHVNISAPVWSNKDNGYLAKVYGAGRGIDTWSEYTEVNLNSGAKVYEVYGGGEMGHVLNAESVQKYMQLYKNGPSDQIAAQDPFWNDDSKWDIVAGMRVVKDDYKADWQKDWADAWTLGGYYTPTAKDTEDEDNDDDTDELSYTDYVGNANTNLTNDAIVTNLAAMDDRDYSGYTAYEKAKRQYRYNTNVRIHEGATVVNYAYGGGLGDAAVHLSGDIYGSTYIALLGGTVKKDIYAACTSGAVDDVFGVGSYDATTNPTGFTASANAYIKGGTCRNVYGGGWKGDVGVHRHPATYAQTEDITLAPTADIPGETHVVIGDLAGTSFTNGIPAIQRNAYGGGEGEEGVNGGMIFGTAHLTLNNGYVGYQYNPDGTDDPDTEGFDERYEKKIEDDTKATPNTLLTEAGCLFGGGYTDNSYVDKTVVSIFGGHVRNSAFGGGEVAAIGRGDMKAKGGSGDYELKGIYRPGKTMIEMYGGQVHKNVYGGGRGFDNLSRVGTLHSSGYVFGQTEVHIHGGEIGTAAGVADGDGNVFGGGDVGHVYSAYENDPDDVDTYGPYGWGVKSDVRYGGLYQGYYYKHRWENRTDSEDQFLHENGDERIFTEDCKVLVEPHMKVISPVTIDRAYAVGEYVPTSALNTLRNKNLDAAKWNCLDPTGIIIHNAVFAGGNTPSGSTTNANTASVFGNATASINDIFHRDMITLGTRHTGGLYGDGNLTLVDGYRELNITNYGTDYYSIAQEIGINDYRVLPEREAAYYELNYTCLKTCQDKKGNTYSPKTGESKASTITADDMLDLFLVENNGTYSSYVYGGKAVLIWNESKKEWEPNPDAGYWEESGVLPVYAGRLMNSIQRADFCGVFGSRMVMQGAKDRVPEEADYTNYTINRVREVSLNKKESVIASDLAITEDNAEYYKLHTHGNYFGIYNVVNYLGALTSDVDFGDETSGTVRKTDNPDETTYQCSANGKTYGNATYYDWKKQFIHERKRNNGSSHNKVALASGVYLEITTEESTGDGLYEKVWGPITGVVELDLINVSTGIGGGFVYAQNVHGVRKASGRKNTTLTALNNDAVTHWDYIYNPPETLTGDVLNGEDAKSEWQSSGNFVHSTLTIIDDCYNTSNKYKSGYMPPDGVPAHFWYIKGSTYVYDQYISAYTGIPNAYSETVDIPLTIAAASHGRMKLLNVMPNLYAYYSAPGEVLGDGKKITINDKAYYKNDPISYWDWYLLGSYEKQLFQEKTYVNCITCKIDGVKYEAGTYVMNETDLATYKAATGGHTYTDADGQTIKDANDQPVGDDYIFRLSNNVSHDTGYILTYKVDNPAIWNTWYTPKNNTDGSKITLAAYNELTANKDKYEDGPTYRLRATEGGELLGQRDYEVGDIISEDIQTTYTAIPAGKKPTTGQAVFEQAYVVTQTTTVTVGTTEHHLNKGTTIIKSDYEDVDHNWLAALQGKVDEAYICTRTIQQTKENLIYKDSKLSEADKDAYISDVKGKMKYTIGETTYDVKDKSIDEIKALTGITDDKKKELLQLATLRDDLNTYLVPAYACQTAGKYGGDYYEAGRNYRGLEAWSSMTESDRAQFIYNYDALDLLIDPTYSRNADGTVNYAEGQKYQYDDSEGTLAKAQANLAHYSLQQPVDYTASYNGKDGDATETAEGDNNGKKYMTVSTDIISSGKVYIGDELTREQFESLPNEQRHFSSIAVKSGVSTYYVVSVAFQVGSTPYAVGETISSEIYKGLPDSQKDCVTELKFTTAPTEDKAYYYCREEFDRTTSIATVSSSDIANAGTGYNATTKKVAKGSIIEKSTYDALTNQQKNFTIHGVSPTETSTLYVSHESDIYDLSQEKIITVIYQYDYDETDGSGNVTPISERHVVNIHLNFRSGVPTVEDIEQPEIILPGDYVGLREPNVTPGAYEVTGGGWELFESQRDAESHTNGIDYDPNFDPLYWYQDGHYVAYYAKSYLGRTYSNAVPVAVANYHDLKKVMDATTHHYYIDNKNVKREPKIYINDYSGSDENGLDLFKNLYDLSLLNASTVNTDEEGLITTIKETSKDSPFKGHALLDSRVQGGSKLEFFLRTDIERETETVANPAHETDPEAPETITRYKTWTPIASGENDPCFSGTFHGDGHTLSGLDHSVFGKLCGDVYNLGVTGSFTSAGVADLGDGYVESCWVKSTATALPDGASKTNPVFGDPSRGSGYQLVNSYFWEGNSALYNTVPANGSITYTNSSKGTAYAMTAQEFYNGTVAYDLNNFYLYKRYRDKNRTSSKATSYYYLPVQTDGTLPETPSTGYYPAAEDAQLCDHGYVESRFTDGDFRYAAGEIPTSEDERYWQETVSGSGETAVKEDRWSPIYPDDYIFFGQKLTYGWAAQAHQEVPTAVVRDGGRLSQNTDANRVYRAPAYYRSKKMGVAHFNPHAYLAQKEKLTAEQIAANATPRTAYPGMTAIDFAGHNDLTYQLALVSNGLPIGGNTFYPPLLDDDGLLGITNCDETRNLLAYAPAATATTGYANQKTFNVLTGYFVDPDYNDYYDDTDHYRLVNKNDMPVVGHLVQSDLTATGDHFLVDKQDFNAPFQYTFDGSHRMWYQRLPENYVDRTKGWEGVSLPFTAELVTTHQKGEITHFYSGSTTSRNSTSKIGHEYWLRELENGSNLLQAKDKNNAVIANTYTAVFNYPSAAGSNKTVTNHFLWDYYYSQSDRKDKNTDIYQEYYHTDRTYPNYSFLTAAKPYIIGFPGRTYYEFDLSGEFSPLNTFAAIADLEQQTITFAANTNATINVSDDEMTGTEAKDGNTIYYFKPNYMNRTYEASSNTFIMNAEGSQFNEVTATATLDAFRPYFTTNADAQVKGQTRSIIFSINDEDIQPQMPDGQLHIRGSRHAILVTSAMTEPATVNIVNAAGVTVNTFTIQPGQTIKTNVIAGVYIVNQKKIAVD